MAKRDKVLTSRYIGNCAAKGSVPASISHDTVRHILQVLPVRQITECCGIEISSFQPAWFGRLDAISASILIRKQQPQRDNRAHFEEMADDHTPDTQGVCRTLICLVEKWSGDIACAVSQEQHSVCHDLLRMSSRVGYLQGQNHDECRIVGSGQEIADVAAYSLVEGDETKAEGAGNVGAEKYQDKKASFVDEFVVQVDTHQDGQRDEGAVGNLHKCCDERAEAESFDNDGSKVGNAAIRNVSCSCVNSQNLSV